MQTLSSRRSIANAIAAKQGLPVTQDAIDARWAGIAAQLNATLPSSRSPIGAPRALAGSGTVKPTQGDIDATWSAIVTKLNAEAGLATR
jgi:hypothetical protein